MRRRQFLQSSLGIASSALLVGPSRADTVGAALSEVQAAMLDGRVRSLSRAVIKDLRDALHGVLLLPSDDGYDDARRLTNRQFDKHPALIIQATGAEDVRAAVNFARENNLLVAVKGGGHSDFGVSSCDGGMVIDLSPMRGVRVDRGAKRAWVSGATLAGLIDHETVSQGLVVPLGGDASVGIGGLATGGGIGKMSRRFGLTLDSIRSIDVVTAKGQFVHASATENPDLFWAVRGGGGNFGVVTDLELELHPIAPRVIAGTVSFALSELKQVLGAYADYTAQAPDELYLECFISARMTAETSILQLNVCYSGNEGDAERILQPIKRFGHVLRDDTKVVSYIAAQGADTHLNSRKSTTASRPAADVFFRAGFLEGFDAALVTTLAERITPHAVRRINMLFLHAGGAIARVPNSVTAFSRRSATHDMILVSSWPHDGAAGHLDDAQTFWADLLPHTRGFYTNDMAGGAPPEAVATNFGGNYPRLASIKSAYDPHNLFRLNANILPAPG